jgi:hypothetical protein
MNKLLGWTARQINRRNFLRGSAVGVFGAMAGLATAQVASAHVGCSPLNGLYCNDLGGNPCTSAGHCSHNSQWSCGPNLSIYPHSGGCWSSGGKLCCDCNCYTPAGGGINYGCTCAGY